MKPKKRRKRSPGVTLIKPDGAGHRLWRVRYVDPDTGKTVKRSIDPSVTTKHGREDYAADLAEQLAARSRALDAGALSATGLSFAETVERFYTDHGHLRARTVETYRLGTDRLVDWARRAGVDTADDLTRARLLAFRARLIAAPRQYSTGGGKQGAKARSESRRSEHTINKEIRAIKRALGYLVDLDLFCRLSHDDIRRGLKPLKAPVERKAYLKAAELRALLEAAQRHDAATYTLTRVERAEGEAEGATPRYTPIAPFVVFVLLTGMRLGEALALDWSAVDLDALDARGRKVGEIYLDGASNKTKHARTVGLEVSPALRRLLAAQRLATGGKGSVWQLTPDEAIKAMRRLRATYGAPAAFSWQVLRVSCATYLNNAPGVYGAAAAFMAAKQLGHSVAVSERHYAGVLRGIPADARTLETAMQIEAEVAAVSAGNRRMNQTA